jgi:uncharacterized protein (DUF2235 family)
MADIVVCCDGTWQDAINRSNVSRLYDALDESVVRCYVKGVGTGDLMDKLRGGLTGNGLADSLKEGYEFLVREYRPGDHISLFGFSRGAYTARSLAGMVGDVGIVDRRGLAERDIPNAVEQAFRRYEALKAERKAETARKNAASVTPLPGGQRDSSISVPPQPWSEGLRLAYDPNSSSIPVVLVGVWDTVGALGIPAYIGVPDVFHSRERYEFMHVVLDPRIRHARQAVSLDEMRGPFRPTLWAEPASGQDMKQIWFPGDHCDVGGGHKDDTGLSDGALLWMIDQAAATVHLPFKQNLGIAPWGEVTFDLAGTRLYPVIHRG